jgi:hypothetical protein
MNSGLMEIVLILLFVFLAMSAIVSLAQQFIVQAFRMRSRNLRACIVNLLSDKTYGDGIARRFFRHPLVASINGGRSFPTAIPSETFVAALATAIKPAWAHGDAIDCLPASVSALQDGDLKKRLVLIMPPPGAPRQDIERAAVAWFDHAAARMGERFKTDSLALSWGIAAAATLLFNVSAVEVINRLQSNAQLRQTFAAAVPQMASAVYGGSLSTSAALAAVESAGARPSAAAGASVAGPELNAVQPGAMYTVFRCAQDRSAIPIGWPWMADLAKRADAATRGADSAAQAFDPCADALDKAGLVGQSIGAQENSASAEQVQGLVASLASTSPAEPTIVPRYGTDPDRDGWPTVLAR